MELILELITKEAIRNFSLSLLLILLLENVFRKNYPTSRYRPTFAIHSIATKLIDLYDFIGRIIAKFSDLFYILREFIAEDLFNLCCESFRLLTSFVYIINSYYKYYYNNYNNDVFVYMLFSVICMLIISFGFYFGYKY